RKFPFTVTQNSPARFNSVGDFLPARWYARFLTKWQQSNVTRRSCCLLGSGTVAFLLTLRWARYDCPELAPEPVVRRYQRRGHRPGAWCRARSRATYQLSPQASYDRVSDGYSRKDQMIDLALIDGPSAWVGGDLRPEDYRVELSPACHDEIRRAVDELRAFPLPTIVRRPEDFAMPACPEPLARVRGIL